MTTPREQVPKFLSPKSSAIKRRAQLVERKIEVVERLSANARQGGAEELPVSYLRDEMITLMADTLRPPGWIEKVEVLESAISFYRNDGLFDSGSARASKGFGLSIADGFSEPACAPPS